MFHSQEKIQLLNSWYQGDQLWPLVPTLVHRVRDEGPESVAVAPPGRLVQHADEGVAGLVGVPHAGLDHGTEPPHRLHVPGGGSCLEIGWMELYVVQDQ